MIATAPCTLVVGTSPPMLLRALGHAQAGEQVTIVEQRAIVGGSWATPPLLGLDAVESGAHLLENRSQFYKALTRLGIRMAPEQGCLLYWRGHPHPMQKARARFHALVALNGLRRLEFDRFRRIGTSAWRSLGDTNIPFLYPERGCAEINDQLLARLAEEGVTPRFGIAIERIDIPTIGPAASQTADGPLFADRIAIASRAHAPIFIEGAEFRAQYETGCVNSLVIRGRDPQRAFYGYVELMRDPLLQRLRDITRFCRPDVPAPEFVLCAQVRQRGLPAFAEGGIEAIHHHLRSIGLLSDLSEILASEMCRYEYRTMTDASLGTLERAARGRIVAVRTTDFADGFLESSIGRPAFS